MKCRVAHNSVSFDVEVRPACGTTVLNRVVLSGHSQKCQTSFYPLLLKPILFILREYLRLDSVVSRVSVQQDN